MINWVGLCVPALRVLVCVCVVIFIFKQARVEAYQAVILCKIPAQLPAHDNNTDSRQWKYISTHQRGGAWQGKRCQHLYATTYVFIHQRLDPSILRSNVEEVVFFSLQRDETGWWRFFVLFFKEGGVSEELMDKWAEKIGKELQSHSVMGDIYFSWKKVSKLLFEWQILRWPTGAKHDTSSKRAAIIQKKRLQAKKRYKVIEKQNTTDAKQEKEKILH